MWLNHFHCQITDDAIALYRAEANENPMYDQVTELRQANKRLEEKYEQEVAANLEKDKEVEGLRARLRALEKQNQKKDYELRDSRIRERATSLRSSPPRAPPSRPEAEKPKKKKQAYTGGSLGPVQSRMLTLKQLKEVINDIFLQKQKFDRKCRDSGQALETLEQYMFTYLN